MVRLVLYLIAIALTATGLGWLADRPGSLHVVWQGYDMEMSVFHAVLLFAATITAVIFLWSVFKAVLNSPALIGQRIVRRRQKKGLDALSSGLIAIGSGDSALAGRYALQARRTLPHEPLTHLLRAQAADLAGDRVTARRIYEAMLASSETEQLGLRGLFIEAEREHADEAAKQYAARALAANPKLGWSSTALFSHQCKQKDWAGAIETLERARKNGHMTKAAADRARAVLLAACANELEETMADKALALALEAHALAPDLVPSAALAGRILASKGSTGKAAKVLQRTWTKSPHPDLAAVYAHVRPGDSTRDRFDRVRQLAALNPHSMEGPIAVATVAVDARMFDDARRALEPLLSDRLTHRVAMLMARIEAGDNGDKGRVREWLARAAHAPRDPVWLADGIISDTWEPISPIDGRLDAFQWRVPIETRDASRTELLARRLEELIALEAPAAEPDGTTDDESVVTVDLSNDGRATADADARLSATPDAVTASVVANADAGRVVTNGSGSGKSSAGDAAKTTMVPNREDRTSKTVTTATPETRLFPANRAPDDPGIEDIESDLADPAPRRGMRSVN